MPCAHSPKSQDLTIPRSPILGCPISLPNLKKRGVNVNAGADRCFKHVGKQPYKQSLEFLHSGASSPQVVCASAQFSGALCRRLERGAKAPETLKGNHTPGELTWRVDLECSLRTHFYCKRHEQDIQVTESVLALDAWYAWYLTGKLGPWNPQQEMDSQQILA